MARAQGRGRRRFKGHLGRTRRRCRNWVTGETYAPGEDKNFTKSPNPRKQTMNALRLLGGNCGRDQEGGGLGCQKETISDAEKFEPQAGRSG